VYRKRLNKLLVCCKRWNS